MERRDKKDDIDDGLYSTGVVGEVVVLILATEARASSSRCAAFSFLEAARDKIADR